jgi:hypothetical protein
MASEAFRHCRSIDRVTASVLPTSNTTGVRTDVLSTSYSPPRVIAGLLSTCNERTTA